MTLPIHCPSDDGPFFAAVEVAMRAGGRAVLPFVRASPPSRPYLLVAGASPSVRQTLQCARESLTARKLLFVRSSNRVSTLHLLVWDDLQLIAPSMVLAEAVRAAEGSVALRTELHALMCFVDRIDWHNLYSQVQDLAEVTGSEQRDSLVWLAIRELIAWLEGSNVDALLESSTELDAHLERFLREMADPRVMRHLALLAEAGAPANAEAPVALVSDEMFRTCVRLRRLHARALRAFEQERKAR